MGCHWFLIVNHCNLTCRYLMWVTGDVWAAGRFIFGIRIFFTTPFSLALFIYIFFTVFSCLYLYMRIYILDFNYI